MPRSTSKKALSKSLYTKGLQCHKGLWLHKYRPELRDEESVSLQATFAAGTDVGVLAQQLFPGGVLVPYEGLSYDQQVEMTRSTIAAGTRTIYEASFRWDGIFVKADILHRGRRGWELYEVKGSTGVKDVYLHDIAVQQYVIAGAGLKIVKSSLVHINNGYIRDGAIKVKELFSIADLTAEIKGMQSQVPKQLAAMRSVLNVATMPDIDIGPHCHDPYQCSFKGHCWQHIPYPSVFDFADVGKPDPFALYDEGLIKMADVPPERLKWRQKLQLETMQEQSVAVDAEELKVFLDDLWYPLCFLDFETTCLTPVPYFDGTAPFDKVPFQFSLHIVDRPRAKPRHHEFLAKPGQDPRKAFLDSLLAVVPDDGCIIAWNQGFEIGRLDELSRQFPRKKKQITALIKNFRDLMEPFRKKWLYHWEFNGSYSLKAVLPALVPEMSYEGMPVSNGGEASIAWLSLWEEQDGDRIAAVQQYLLDYCCLDTLAMVKILDAMKGYVGKRRKKG